MTPSREEALAAVLARRERHRRRSVPLRAAWAILGFAVLAVSLVVVLVAPEFGIPLTLWALSILALEFDWAVRAHARVVWYWARVRNWFRRRSPAVKAVVVVGTVAVVALIVAIQVLR